MILGVDTAGTKVNTFNDPEYEMFERTTLRTGCCTCCFKSDGSLVTEKFDLVDETTGLVYTSETYYCTSCHFNVEYTMDGGTIVSRKEATSISPGD